MLQPNEFKIYNASAGAGKTYTLVKEYISILLSNPNPFAFESILAITFTNKAANEMKERILQQLVNFSKADFAENKDLTKWSAELNLSPEEIHHRSRKVLVNILHNYSRFSVSTIDKFNLRLMKSFAQDLGLSVNFNVEMEQEKLFEESVHQLFAKIGEDELLTSVLIEIALDNLYENKSWDISRELIKNASSLYYDSHLVQLSKLQKYNLKEFNEFRKIVFSKTAQKKNALINNASVFFKLISENGVSIGDLAGGASGIGGYFNKFLKEDFAYPTKTHLKNIENTDPKKFTSGNADPSLNSIIENIFPSIQQLFRDSVEFQKDLPLWEGIQKTIVSLSILNEVEKSIETIKEDQNVLLISEFNKRISSSLQKQPSGFIYERIGNRFHHYFIDEFQDTSTLQWENLYPLVENARASSDTVMLVGDPKQSIYRWRGGNPEQMLELIKDREKLDISVENLPKNWRSHENIIAFNNEFYQRISEELPIETYKSLYKEGNNQLTNAKKGGYVQLNFIPKKEETIENYTYKEGVLHQVLEQINSLKNQGFQWDEIAILHRTKEQGKWIAEFLTEQQIPILSSESLLIKNSNEIRVLELFFKTISNPEDKVSKTNFLLEFHQLKNQLFGDITLTIQSVLHQNLFSLKTLLEGFGFDISFAFEPSVSLYDFVEKAIKKLELEGKTDAYLQYFLDYVLEYSMQNEYNFQRFLEHWDSQKEKLSISSPEGVNAIQLMTIHKSKGLEFPVVILPFADWGDRTTASKFWIPIQEEELPFDEFMVQSFGNLENVNDEIKAIIDREKNEILLDNLNLLYVATTRAIEQLYILTQKEAKSGVGNYFSDQFSGADEIAIKGEKIRISTSKKESPVTEKISFVAENWENRIEISRESSKRWKKKKEIVYGEWVHELMQFILTEKDVLPILQKEIIAGKITNEELPEMEKKMTSLLYHPELEPYFKEGLTVLNERDFIDEKGEIFRPDRLVLDGKNCTIIDYKTGAEKPEHISQIKYYAENLQKSGYKIEKKFLVYIGDKLEVKKI